MPDLLPLFPLQLVVFPGENLNLHIFEPRYQELIKDCEEEAITFGIPAHINGRLMPIGTEVRLEKVVKKYPNGESDVKTKGMGLFIIRDFMDEFPGKLYSGATVDRIAFDLAESSFLNEQILEKTEELFDLLDIDKSLPDTAEGFSIFDVAHYIGLTIDQEYKLLEIEKAEARQKYFLDHLTRLIPVVRHMEEIKEKARMNGHFKRIEPLG